MMAKMEKTTYFEDTGKWRENTATLVQVVGQELRASRVRHVVFATCRGYTGAQFAPLAKANPKVSFVGVAMATAVDKLYGVKWNARWGRAMEKAGISFARGTHALTGGVDRALCQTFDGGFPPGAIIAQTLYLFSQGMKVAVEVIAMACDAGLLPEGVKVIGCGGTGSGADTAILATSAGSANLFKMKIHRVLAMPS
jgi:hypothetical protein